MSQREGISTDAVIKRLQRAGRKPYMYIGVSGVYKEEDWEAIKGQRKRGRQPSAKEEPAPESEMKEKVPAKLSKKSKK